MSDYKNDFTLKEIKTFLENEEKEVLIDLLLKTFWEYPKMLNNTEVFKKYLIKQKEEFVKNNP